jgi:hypothetical protein
MRTVSDMRSCRYAAKVRGSSELLCNHAASWAVGHFGGEVSTTTR